MFLEAKNIHKSFRGNSVRAVDGVSFCLERGRTLGVVGESGSGKSTLMKIVLKLLRPDEGEVLYEGKKVGAIFQDAALSLNPKMTVGDSLKEPLIINGQTAKFFLDQRIAELLSAVELPSNFAFRYPAELSGGECQRVSIARAVSLRPELIVCDEPVSSLDLIAQAQVLNLLLKLQKEYQVSYLFVSHDLRVVRHMSDDVLVMKDGQTCEYGPAQRIFSEPKHPYTRQLLLSSF